MAVGMTVLDEVLGEGFLDHVKSIGARLRSALEQLIPNHDMFEDVRGLGLMLGVKMKSDYDARAFVAHLRDNHGLLTVSAGQRSEEHTSELQSLMRISYAFFCLQKKPK